MNHERKADSPALFQAKTAQSSTPCRTVAIKFCGGCNPTFDRLIYWDKIKAETSKAIRWVSPDHPRPDGFLLISGCRTSCPLKFINPDDYALFLQVSDPADSPEAVAEKLTS